MMVRIGFCDSIYICAAMSQYRFVTARRKRFRLLLHYYFSIRFGIGVLKSAPEIWVRRPLQYGKEKMFKNPVSQVSESNITYYYCPLPRHIRPSYFYRFRYLLKDTYSSNNRSVVYNLTIVIVTASISNITTSSPTQSCI